jgi:SAM-dependent methyltransferase
MEGGSVMDARDAPVEGNYYNKYEAKGFVEKRIMRGFWRCVESLLGGVEFASAHEVGCGEGYVSGRLSRIYQGKEWSASDVSERMVELARARVPGVRFIILNTTFAIIRGIIVIWVAFICLLLEKSSFLMKK